MDSPRNRQLITALERERRFLADELHEGLCQTLCGVSIHLKVLQRRLESECPALAEEFSGLQKTIDDGIDQSRVLYRTLKPPVSGGDTLMQAMVELVKSKPASLDFQESFREGADRLSPEQATALLRIAQEALRDSISNPTVTAANICLKIDKSSVRMSMDDNRHDSSAKRDPVSLGVIAAHARAVAGSARLATKTDSNGAIECVIPLAANPAQSNEAGL